MRKLVPILTLVLLAAATLTTTAVNANVPTVLSITRKTDSVNTLIDVKVNHADPTSTHYISQITLDLDGTTKTFTDLPKTTTTEAIYTLNIGATTPKTVKAQATCSLHGPSAWFTEAVETTGNTGGTTGGGVPAYPSGAIFIGVVLAVILLLMKKR
jgi:hypothetical protein